MVNVTIDPVFAQILELSLFALLTSSGIEKLKNRNLFSQALIGYQLLSVALIPVFSIIIPLLEISLAVSLLVTDFRPTVFFIAALLAVYASAIYINIRRGNLSLECGCRLGEAHQTISMALVYRNLVLGSGSLMLLLPKGERLIENIDYAAIVFGFLASVLLYVTANLLIASATTYREMLS